MQDSFSFYILLFLAIILWVLSIFFFYKSIKIFVIFIKSKKSVKVTKDDNNKAS